MAPKVAPKMDHMRANRQQIAEAQALNRERQRQDEAMAERKQAIIDKQRAQYAHATGKVFAPSEGNHGPAPSDDVEISVYVRECEPDAQRYTQLESAMMQAAAQRRGAASASAAPAQQQQRQPLAPQPQQRAVASRPPPTGPGAPALNLRRGSADASTASAARGQVPQYLQQRKAELEAEKNEARRIADLRAEQAKYPPGHRPVGEDERLEILSRLQKRRTELEADLGRLPLRFDTQAIAQRRKQIETELQEIEAADRKFSVKKQLFVPI